MRIVISTCVLSLMVVTIDAADPAGCSDVDGSFLSHDQIGRPRPYLKGSDIGAFETGPSGPIYDDGFENGNLYWSEVVAQ